MSSAIRSYIVNNIKLPINASYLEAFSVAKSVFKKLGIFVTEDDMRIYRKSTDARDKENIIFVYSVIASGLFPQIDKQRLEKYSVNVLENEKLNLKFGEEKLSARPLIVGTGPAGLFSALLLADML